MMTKFPLSAITTITCGHYAKAGHNDRSDLIFSYCLYCLGLLLSE